LALELMARRVTKVSPDFNTNKKSVARRVFATIRSRDG
jgi:hypothetical protein